MCAFTVLMHASSDEAHRFGLDAQVNIMAHGLWNWSQETAATSEMPPGIKKILDDEVTHNLGWQPTMQVLHGIRDLFSASFLSDQRLARVPPSSLIDWNRSPESQRFRALICEDVKLPAGANPMALAAQPIRLFDPIN